MTARAHCPRPSLTPRLLTWTPPTVAIEREELLRLARELRSVASLLPYNACPGGVDPAVFRALKSVRSDIERTAVSAAECIERLLQEASGRTASRNPWCEAERGHAR